MFCLYPMLASYTDVVNPATGKRKIVILGKAHGGDSHSISYESKEMSLGSDRFLIPCGQCIVCRLNHAKDWATRCVLESRLYDENMFLTLTYRNEDLPLTESGFPTLKKDDVTLFMKRFRYWLSNFDSDKKIRFYMCGEYGSQFQRSHYHMIVFGFQFKDLEVYRADKNIYISKTLEKLWSHGFCTVGAVSMDSCMYVARYILKKQTGAAASVYADRQEEYTNMSRMPGIGFPYLEKYGRDIYAIDKCVISDKLQCKPSRYFDDKFGEIDADKFESVKRNRLDKAIQSLGQFVDEDSGEVMPMTVVDSWRNESMKELLEVRNRNKERGYETGSYKTVKVYKKMI